MSGIDDIIMSAWNKDSVNLKAAVDAVLSDRIDAAVQDYTKDFSASMFSATTGEPEVEQEAQEQQTQDSAEVAQDENV